MKNKANINNIIPIIFSVTENYVPIFGTCLQSLIANSSSKNHYSIYIFNENISENNQKRLQSMCPQNFILRFIDITPYLKQYDIKDFFQSKHITIATYYRFFIPQIFKDFDKVIYSDSDVIYEKDIAELYAINIGDNIIGATLSGWQYVMNDDFKHYATKILKIKDPYQYIQGGVLLCNVRKMISINFTQQCMLTLKRIKKTRTWDQCVINSVCDNNIYYLDRAWNLEWHYPFCHKNYEQNVLQHLYDDYLEARKNPNIIHYASSIKPWTNPEKELSSHFWLYARQSPFYEEMLRILLCPKVLDEEKIQIIKDLSQIRKLKWKYLFFKIIAQITHGKLRKKYQDKKKNYKKRIKNIKSFLQEL